uniref:Uncharacterized protein n=1 Tax=Tanacetum cinerariifolium TaxID=118510 RepID=A0A6L2MRV7_TANCI|nr:hypothetical protein [Tanacetum cinerariifolium]
MDSCWTYGNPFHSYENFLEEIASRKERVPETYDFRSQYDAYEYDTYHANYNIEMEDDTMYRGAYGDQYFHPSSYETPSFFNQPQRPTQEYYCQRQKQALETHVDRLLDQLNKDETYEPQEEAEVTHIHLNPPQLPRVVINQVGVDDSVFENEKEQANVSFVKDEHHVVERCYENSFSELTHIILK